jgi:hypothetical protein
MIVILVLYLDISADQAMLLLFQLLSIRNQDSEQVDEKILHSVT